MRPGLLDLFCGAGGCAIGYYRAGFEVAGIDISARRASRYPFRFIQADAVEYLEKHGGEYNVIHAAPVCQLGDRIVSAGYCHDHPNPIPHIRGLLRAAGKPYVIECVTCARGKLIEPVLLCGHMFGLPFHQHRHYETWLMQIAAPGPRCTVIRFGERAARTTPPEYTEWIGRQILAML